MANFQDQIAFEEIKKAIEDELKYAEDQRAMIYRKPGSNIDPEKLIMNVSYPVSDEWEYETELINLNLDQERIIGLRDYPQRNKLITSHQPIQKQQWNNDGINSPEFFGGTLQDVDPYMQRYRCPCGKTKGEVYKDTLCPYCKKKVRFLGDDFGKFGWMVLDKYYLIHPNLYKDIESLVGGQQALINILSNESNVDENGHVTDELPEKPLSAKYGNKASRQSLKRLRRESTKKDKYDGIGMLEFFMKFDEIIDYYYNKASNKAAKKKWYDRIKQDRDKIFTHSVPLYTTHMRPIELSGDKTSMAFEGTNANYNMISKIIYALNNDKKLKMNQHVKLVDNYLWSAQREWNDLYTEIDAILSDKKGNVRLLCGGRCNFSGRSVIIQNPKLRSDQVILPYSFLVIILQQQIINILHKTYGISYNDARNRWELAIDSPDKTIIQIIYGIMRTRPEGLPVIVNRNPSINRGSLMQMFCIDMSFNYTMALPLSVLEAFGADFDGDVLNIFYIINEAFFQRCFQVINPRNSLNISNNDGFVDTAFLPYKDTLINANTFRRLGKYTEQQKKAIEEFKKRNNIV